VIEILWEFVVRKDKIGDFERNYGPTGSWADFFARSPAFRGTVLLRGAGGRYITRDGWDNVESFHNFRRQYAQEYDELDRLCEGFTESEKHLGTFELI
jgi:hypothetical protein